MTDAQAFKLGFRMRCIDEGLSAEQTRDRMEKAASMLKHAGIIQTLMGLLSGGAKVVGNIAKPIVSHGLTAALVGPPLAGVGGGYALSRLNNDVYNKDEAKTDEELAELYRAIEELQRSQQLAAK